MLATVGPGWRRNMWILLLLTVVTVGAGLVALGMILRGSSPGQRPELLRSIAAVVQAWRTPTTSGAATSDNDLRQVQVTHELRHTPLRSVLAEPTALRSSDQGNSLGADRSRESSSPAGDTTGELCATSASETTATAEPVLYPTPSLPPHTSGSESSS